MILLKIIHIGGAEAEGPHFQRVARAYIQVGVGCHIVAAVQCGIAFQRKAFPQDNFVARGAARNVGRWVDIFETSAHDKGVVQGNVAQIHHVVVDCKMTGWCINSDAAARDNGARGKGTALDGHGIAIDSSVP